MNRKWLYDSRISSNLVLNTSSDLLFGFTSRYQKYHAWRNIYTEDRFILILTEVFLDDVVGEED